MPNIFVENWSQGLPEFALTHRHGVISPQDLGKLANRSHAVLSAGAEGLWPSALGRSELAERRRRLIADQHVSNGAAAQCVDVLAAPDLEDAHFAEAA